MIRLDVAADTPIDLKSSRGDQAHLFEQRDIDAVEAALAAERPLLLRGEPGVGKSQLARAAAAVLKRPLVSFTVDAQTAPRDLRWSEDAIARLADAQMIAALGNSDEARDMRTRIGVDYYVTPGPLWWAFDWAKAVEQCEKARVPSLEAEEGTDPANGVVVLIDEIDKADAEVPNGLLEALGAREFTPIGQNEAVTPKIWPLVVITTNEERVLPAAFLRRCVVRDIRLPEDDEDLIALLIRRGAAHFPDMAKLAPKRGAKVSKDKKDEEEAPVLQKAAEMLVTDRNSARQQRRWPIPGQAEYLDLLRAVHGEGNEKAQIQRLDALAPYFLEKHLGGQI